ncbi:hypothetical protein IFM89_008584 [Coptis chinensis]|uniref:U-box domain-containing protein n=1 Tax=Coptis chinensis TaxID=261450 RepID=A0A835I0K1_9MAGN|nr:hypothetical protein IFM89_008584 [Coptis chinensis]
MEEEGRSLSETPTWAVATVITVLVSVGFLFQGSLKRAGKWSCSVIEQWLVDTKRKALHAALQKIKEELMLFGVLSLLMGHSINLGVKICVKFLLMDTRFYPCTYDGNYNVSVNQKSVLITSFNSSKYSVSHEQMNIERREHCPEGFVISDWQGVDRIIDPPHANYSDSSLCEESIGRVKNPLALSPRGKKDAATAIFNLLIYQGNKVRAVRAGIVVPLMRLLTDAAGGMVDEALAILAILASHQEGRVAIGQAEPTPVLVEVMRTGSPHNRENVAAVLWSLCIADGKHLKTSKECGVEEALKDLS